jgi:hypothetical protein
LDHRSHKTRSNRAKSARLNCAALVLLCLTGCQSNSDRDLIARDRRLEEDQLYAMQDYISQYQQLVCRYRRENATLKRQLTDESASTSAVREPQPIPRTPNNTPGTYNGPKIDIPPTPGTGKKNSPGPDIELPDVPPPNVPPLKRSTSDDADRRFHQSVSGVLKGRDEPDRYAEAASYAELQGKGAIKSPASAGGAAAEDAPANGTVNEPANGTSPDILLSGEVVQNESGGGPRLVVDIESFDRSGRITQFDGTVSMMLVSTSGDKPRKLARWDFGPDNVRAAVDANADEPTMRFHVELPAGTQADGSTELWVRLAPTSGDKLLSHAKVDLSRPGVFSSRANKLWASEESVIAASYVETSTAPAETAAPVNEGTWAVALPGKPANLPPDSDAADGGWKATKEPLPEVVVSAKQAAPKRIARKSNSESLSKSTHAASTEMARKPAWTPERPGNAAAAKRPSWSATR